MEQEIVGYYTKLWAFFTEENGERSGKSHMTRGLYDMSKMDEDEKKLESFDDNSHNCALEHT